MLDDELKLGELLYHRNDAPSDFLGQHHHFDVFVILEPVADNRRIVIGNRKNG